jgi:hypothetical protein
MALQVMQALSHFSYHKSGGQLVLCDLQGGMLSRGRGAVLTGVAATRCSNYFYRQLQSIIAVLYACTANAVT